jgi:two-component system cell cycle response regulator
MAQSVLVIDDSADIHHLLRARLKDEDVELSSAMDGRTGMEAVRQLKPDLILLDVDMPELGGFDVCRELKNDPVTAPIPVIFLTGMSDPVKKVIGLDLGAVDYVVKPFDFAELRARVRAALRTVRYQKLLEQQAQIDGLTGLWNRAHFDQRLREFLSAAWRYRRQVSLVMLDIDRFKHVNDTYGHPFGDRVLEHAADILRTGTRLSDVPCRYGGEEFAIILPDTDGAGAITLAERLRSRVAEHCWRKQDQAFTVTASFGIGCSIGGDDAAAAADQIILRADSALYRAKRAGRNCVRTAGVPEPALDTAATQ